MGYVEAIEHLNMLLAHTGQIAQTGGGVAHTGYTRQTGSKPANVDRLNRMNRLLWSVGEPHQAYCVVHVTGTNGKGSSVHMIASLLHAMGLKVGTYTSPHIASVNERIQVNLECVDDTAFGALICEVVELSKFADVSATWFETLTAAAFVHFADVAVDVAVVEVGRLGRFDATNVVDGDVSVITNVGRDHADNKTNWRQYVAHEKAGIIKPESVVVCGDTDTAVRDICRQQVSQSMLERDVHFSVRSSRLAVGGRVYDFETHRKLYKDIYIPLHGEHQGSNASLAICAVEAFFSSELPDNVVEDTMSEIVVPGRFEIAQRQPMVVLDCAHNVDAAHVLLETLQKDFHTSGKRIFVLGMQTGRDIAGFLQALINTSSDDHLIVCTAPTDRAVPAYELAYVAYSADIKAEVSEDAIAGFCLAQELAEHDDVIIIAGSITMVAAIKGYIQN